MPRINIEDKIWSDSRFKGLITSLGGDEEKAIGRLIRAWRIAQEWWTKDRQLIPEKIWTLNGLGEELFEVMLARRSEEGIYVSGATEQFFWLISKKKAGIASGLSRRNKKTIEHNAVSVRTQGEQKAPKNEPPTPTPSLSPPLSLSLTQNTEEKKNKNMAPDKPPPVNTRPTWDAFKSAYVKRWGHPPLQERQTNSQMMAFVRKVGQNAAPEIADFYVRHNDGLYVKACHPVGLLLRDAQALCTQWARGKAITGNDVRQFEKMDATRSQLERIERGEL